MKFSVPFVSVLPLLVAAVVAPLLFSSCGYESIARPEFSTLNRRINLVFSTWVFAETFRESEQYELAAEWYTRARRECELYLDARDDDPVILGLVARIEARLEREELVRGMEGVVRIDGAWLSLDAAVEKLSQEVRPEQTRTGLSPALAKRQRKEFLRGIATSLLGGRGYVTVEPATGYALFDLKQLAENSANNPLRAAVARYLGQTTAAGRLRVKDHKIFIAILLARMVADDDPLVAVAAAKSFGSRLRAIKRRAVREGRDEGKAVQPYEFAVPRLLAELRAAEDETRVSSAAGNACLSAVAEFSRDVFTSAWWKISVAEVALMGYLDGEKPPPGRRSAVLKALRQMPNRSYVTRGKIVEIFWKDPIMQVRLDAAKILGDMDWPAGVTALQLALRTELVKGESENSKELMKALGRTGHPIALDGLQFAIQFGDLAVRRSALKALRVHAGRARNGFGAIMMLAETARTFSGPTRIEAMDYLVKIRTAASLHTLVNLAVSPGPVIAVQAASRLRRIEPAALGEELREQIRAAVLKSLEAKRFQTGLLLAQIVSDRLPAATRKALQAGAKDVNRNLEAPTETVCPVQLRDTRTKVLNTIAPGTTPRWGAHRRHNRASLNVAAIYYYEGLAFHLQPEEGGGARAEFWVDEIEILPNYRKKFLGLRIGMPVLTVIENLGVPSETKQFLDGTEVLFYQRGEKRIRVYCDSVVRRIRYRDTRLRGTSQDQGLTPIPKPAETPARWR